MPVSSAGLPRNRSTPLYSPGSDELQTDNHVVSPDEIVTRSAAPGQIVGEMILMRAVAAQGELHVRFKENIFVSQRRLLAKNAVVRASPKRQIVAVNSTLGRTRNFHFVKFFLEAAAVTGRKFYSGEQNGRGCEVRLMLDRDRILAFNLKCSASWRRIVKGHRL